MSQREFEITDEMLDRLVDGEASESETREIIAGCEASDDGWKQCALAFLEGQAWSRAMRQEAEEAQPPPRVTAPVQQATPKSNPQQISWTSVNSYWITLSAAIVIAFGLGTVSDRWPHQRDDRVRLATDVPESPRGMGSQNLVDSRNQGRGSQQGLTFVVDDGAGGSRQVDVPVVDLQSGREWLQRNSISAHEASVRETLQRNGQIIRQRDRFVAPIETHDGQRYIIPVERWHIEPEQKPRLFQ